MLPEHWQSLLQAAGRTLLALHFLIGGTDHLRDWKGTLTLMANHRVPFPEICLATALVILIGGSIAIVLGYKTPIAALALIAFTILATLIFHNYWKYEAGSPAHLLHYIVFYGNLALIGALLFLASTGAGAISLDSWLRSER